MTPFNLEEAKKGKPVVTRNGSKARFITHLKGGQIAPLLFEVTKKDEDGMVTEETENYYLDGRFETVHNHKLDLFMEDDVVIDEDEQSDPFRFWEDEEDDDEEDDFDNEDND